MNHKKFRLHHTIVSVLLVLALCMGLVPAAFAAQDPAYHDPAEHWQTAINRTNELDANAIVTHETFNCAVCEKKTSFLVFRVPEYTRDGQSALTRNVMYSDGTMVDGEGTGRILDGTPGKDAYYTGYHWTKAVCETCGTTGSNSGVDSYDFDNNVYNLYDCAAEFMEDLPETVTYEYVDDTQHRVTTTSGEFCVFCFGTRKNTSSKLERHTLDTEVLPQPANGRFATVEHCEDCEYTAYDYTAAKAVVASYYGVVDGQPHTITVSDLSESGVTASIRYGNSADNCNMTTAPTYTEAGQYAVYYKITYAYKGKTMTENGVANVWLRDEGVKEDGTCGCGCGDPDCGCEDKDCGGSCCNNKGCGENHKFVLLDSVNPGCLTLGYDRYLCTECGKIEKRDYEAALGHAYQSILIREATCETDGKLLEICTRCGDMKQTATPRSEHQYRTYKVAATCTSPGYTVNECSVCGDRHITDITSSLPHNYKSIVTPATCENSGKTVHLCEGCGSSFVTDYKEPLNHSWDDGKTIAKPSCTGEGVKQYTCKRCGAMRMETINANGHTPGAPATCTQPQLCEECGAVITPALGHSYTEEVTKPTCLKMGFVTFTCSKCNDSYKSEYTDALGHDYVAVVTDPTCTERGYTTYTCSRCDDSYVDDYTDALGHAWDEGTRIADSTCLGDGVMEYRCERCDETYLEAISAKGHTPGAPATCTQPQLCVKCGAVLVPALGHSYTEEVTPPTCLKMGWTTFTCSKCGDSYKSEYTDALGHDYVPVVTEPTCTEKGYTTYTCSHCGDSYVDDYTDALGHAWDEGTKITDSTCMGDGVMQYRCERCDETYLDAISAEGHTPGAPATCTQPQLCEKCGAVIEPAFGHNYTSEVTPPTCTEMGYTTHTCDTCGDSYTDNYTNPTGHKESDWIVDKEPTLNSEGERHKECENCGEKLESESVPRLNDKDVTDNHGEAEVGGYLVIVTDTDTKNPVMGAVVVLDQDNSLSIRLPDGRLLDYADQTTVTVLIKKDLSAVPNVDIAVMDKNDNYCAETTDKSGQITVPGTSGKTNDSGKVTVGGEDEDGNRFTLTVKVEDYENGRPIKEAEVSVSKSGKIGVVLPDGVDMDSANRIKVTVTDHKGKPQEGLDITVRNDMGRVETGRTDAGGVIVVPELEIETAAHNAYIVGYPDGTFGPSNKLTRSEAAAIFARLLAAKNGDLLYDNVHCSFTDVSGKAWYAGAVKYLETYGIVKGYEDGTYRPENTITRSEFVAMAVRFYSAYGVEDIDRPASGTGVIFPDVSDSNWAADYIREAAAKGWVVGYDNGTFSGENDITRAEVVTVINRVLGREADQEYVKANLGRLNTFPDMPANHWAYWDVIEAANNHTASATGTEKWLGK